ncbi:MAG: hypothetical protein F4Z10_07215 [Synechococcus sp. SB0666_bin_14]|nr:hypothetical protein [Synechococcus sp. SB0666_bin_14]MYA91623.1 hypothetical protein [Synechococcus sp. SB0663_bin_10]MYJ60610.1 hypothetical protein [Synechococcus sp. SB0672_bin_6]
MELTAFFARNSTALASDLTDQAGISAVDDYADLNEEIQSSEEDLVLNTVRRINSRYKVLSASAYPFKLDERDEVLTCNLDQNSLGHAAYILSLVLSNLRAVSPILGGSCLHPDQQEIDQLRKFFQYFATAALAAEIYGPAWSFGFPRPDKSGFIKKLTQIWERLGDGQVSPQVGAPPKPKDDQIDVFAARLHPDGLPGFLLAVAQVATGKDADQKSLKGHLDAFKNRWFSPQPVTAFLPYMIVPFAKTDDQFLDTVRVMGNVLHRLRVPRRVAEADKLVKAGETIEGYNQLAEAVEWIASYQDRGRTLT